MFCWLWEGKQYSAGVSLFFFCEIDDKKCHMSYGTQRNPPCHAPFFCIFYYKMAFLSRHPVDILLNRSTMR